MILIRHQLLLVLLWLLACQTELLENGDLLKLARGGIDIWDHVRGQELNNLWVSHSIIFVGVDLCQQVGDLVVLAD